MHTYALESVDGHAALHSAQKRGQTSLPAMMWRVRSRELMTSLLQRPLSERLFHRHAAESIFTMRRKCCMLASCLACSFGDLALEWKRGASRVRFVVSLCEIAVQNHVQNHNSNKKELLL